MEKGIVKVQRTFTYGSDFIIVLLFVIVCKMIVKYIFGFWEQTKMFMFCFSD
jgi:hypothetical protein